jgi:hypothetical protein
VKWSGLLSRPGLIWEALSTAYAFRRRGGVLPSRAALRWRVATAYGSSEAEVSPDDLIRFLEWRRALRAHMRRNR